MKHPGTYPWRAVLIIVAISMQFGPSALAAALQDEEIQVVREAAEQLGEAARARLEPLAEGETKALKAVVMTAKGRSQWRPNAEASWQSAEVDDVLASGAMIRTGRNSSMTLRVGQNATVMVDRHTRLQLPQVLQEGETLRTTVQVSRGRADFKVDRVGLTNDFSVITPSATLAVRGTGYAVEYGGFNGTEVSASRFNTMLAIELRYFVSRFSYYLSGAASSSERHKNPVIHELFKTFGPPRLLSALIEEDATLDQLTSRLMSNPIQDEWDIDQAMSGLDEILDLPIFDEVEDEGEDEYEEFMFEYDFGDWDFEGVQYAGEVAEFICWYLCEIFDLYSGLLNQSGLGDENIDQPEADIEALCEGIEVFVEQDLIDMLNVIVAYCSSQHSDQQAANQCVINFIVATAQQWVEVYEGQ